MEVPDSFVELLEAGTQASIESYLGEHRKELRELFERRDDNLYAIYESDLLLTEQYWKDHLDGILERILRANPSYDNQDVEVFYTLQPTANAAAYGQGVVLINLGLLQSVQSEDELAFVLCHELSHQYLDHINKRLFTRIDKKYSKETQKRLKELKRQEYNVLEELQELVLDLSFENAKHTRYGEREADSLGLVLYTATDYSSEAPLRVMEVLAKADTSLYTAPLDFSTLLNTPSFPFKSRWSYKEPPSPFAKVHHLTQEERDSLRTHPDTEERSAWLSESITVRPSEGLKSEDLTSRKREASKEFIAVYFNKGYLGNSLYQSLRLVDSQDSLWAKGIVALSLYRLAIAREDRHFTENARLPRERAYDEGLEDLLRILHNMRLSDLKALAAAYAKTHATDFTTCGEELALARVLSSTLGDDSPADRARLQGEFKKAFPNSVYNSILRSKDDPWAETLTE